MKPGGFADQNVMKGRGPKGHPAPQAVCAVAIALSLSATASSAQDDGGGLLTKLTFGSELRSEDGDALLAQIAGLTFATETRTQSLTLTANLRHEITEDDQGFVDPSLELDYGLTGSRSELSVLLAYSEQDADSSFLSDDVPGLVVFDGGSRIRSTAEVALDFGMDQPVSGRFELDWREDRFVDTLDPSLLDETRVAAALSLTLDLGSGVKLEPSIAVEEVDRDGGRDVRTEAFDVALSYAARRDLTLTAEIGQSRITESGDVPEATINGTTGSIGFELERPNGTLSGSLSTVLDEAGRRTDLEFDRSLDLPTGEIAMGLGLSRVDGEDDLLPLYRLSHSIERPRDQFETSIEQAFSVDTDGDRALNTRFQLEWDRDLTEASRLNAGLSLSDSRFPSVDGKDSREVALTMAYSHEFVRDWSLTGGLTERLRQEDGAPDDRSRDVFIRLEKTFQWRN